MKMRIKTLWKADGYYPELGTNSDIYDNPMTQIKLECKGYTCPICKKDFQYFLCNGHIVKGSMANYLNQDYCGSDKCSKIIEKKYN